MSIIYLRPEKFEQLRLIERSRDFYPGSTEWQKLLILDRWFARLDTVLTKHNLKNRPEAIYNMDESGFSDDPGRYSVIVKRSTKCATSSHSGTGKSHSTVLMCSSAAGE